jgi:hypothetical protein
MEGKGSCSICAEETPIENLSTRMGLPMCRGCIADIGIDSIEEMASDPILDEILEEKGKNLLPTITSLLCSRTREEGWKLLSMAPFIAQQVEDQSRKTLMECALVLMGSSLIRMGRNEQDSLSEKDATFFLVIGQYLDLSIMGKIIQDLRLDQGKIIDGMILGEAHDHLLFSLLSKLDHEDDDEKTASIIRAMRLLRD